MLKRLLAPGLVAMLFLGCNVQASEAMLYELRTYTANEGKLEALHRRFRNHTMKLFERHGMKNVGYWVPADKPNTLIYLLAHKNAAAAKQSWTDFGADPEWQEVYADSIANGRLVSNIDKIFMTATDYSPMH